MIDASSPQKADEEYTGEAFRPGEPQMRPLPELERGRVAKIVEGSRFALLPCRRGLHAARQFLRIILGKANQWSRKRGGPYWHTILDEEKVDPTPYMTRYIWGRARVHVFFRGDNDPDPHDHPWGFWTFPLISYAEEVTVLMLDGSYETHVNIVRAFRFHYRPASYTHRVLGAFSGDEEWTRVSAAWRTGKIVTLVWRDRDEDKRWGFLKYRDGRWCWVHWKSYLNGGKHAPCE